jgi:hypothetical protein
MKAGWQAARLGDVCAFLNDEISLKCLEGFAESRLKNTTTVRPELVEGQKLAPEFIEAPCPSIHPSTSSGRTDGEELDDGYKL